MNFDPVLKANWFEIPGFYLPFNTGGAFKQYNLYFGPETIAILPIAIVTISEHIGDHTVLSQICGRQFLKQPGLHRTLLGDGLQHLYQPSLVVQPIPLTVKIQALLG